MTVYTQESFTTYDHIRMALNRAYVHYFSNISTGETRKEELRFIADFITTKNLWLFFTEAAMEHTQNELMKDKVRINLVYNLTSLYNAFLSHVGTGELLAAYSRLCDSIYVPNSEFDENKSMIPAEYVSRLIEPKMSIELLIHNKHLVFLLMSMLYLDMDSIVEVIKR